MTSAANMVSEPFETLLMSDVIICEDEPYYCLFTGPWTPQNYKTDQSILAQRQIEAEKKEGKEGNEAFIKALPPTYLKYDTEGRVIRMDVSQAFEPADSRPFPKPLAQVRDSVGSPQTRFSSNVLPEQPSLPPKHQVVSSPP
jgi:hypothetical protein